MKIKFLILLVLCFSSSSYAQSVRIPVDIIKILDGDTIYVGMENNKFPVRLIGIDCYETTKINRAYKQAYNNGLSIDEVITKGVLSKKYLEKLYKNSNKNI